ncbi:diacylglyceryl transferase [Bacillus manliponensis]|uniref:Diacylglyceryl transferase n=1 Tax=Bacillus manliponensis TaxID=574376 RepID=A0A073K076_9BACI|nr:prolipoprotein diacylglyceryl transferase family protein [Bacillus manliponensis]KEK19911.1 diacylglyceryl transferase [Bacillus manliponensis]
MGTWMVNLQMISPVIGSLLGLIIVKQKMKKHRIPHEKVLDMLTNVILIIMITWKFAPAVINPNWVIQSPKAILLTGGSIIHVVIGCTLASGYILLKTRRNRFVLRILLDLLPFEIGIILITYSFVNPVYGFQTELPWGTYVYGSEFTYHPIHLYEIIIVIFLLIWLWIRKIKLGSGIYMSYFLIGAGITRIMLSFLTEQNSFLFGLSVEQWIGFILISIGIILPKK